MKIDFDEASKEWRKNKKKVGKGGMFRYVCGLPRKDGNPCQAPPKHWCRSLRPKNEIFVRDWSPCRHHAKRHEVIRNKIEIFSFSKLKRE